METRVEKVRILDITLFSIGKHFVKCAKFSPGISKSFRKIWVWSDNSPATSSNDMVLQCRWGFVEYTKMPSNIVFSHIY